MLLESKSIHMNKKSCSYVVASDPFDCNEHLCESSWLVVDSPDLLSALKNAKCSNGTAFQNLSSAAMVEICFKETTRVIKLKIIFSELMSTLARLLFFL